MQYYLLLILLVALIGQAARADTDGQELHVIFGIREQVSEPGFLFQAKATS